MVCCPPLRMPFPALTAKGLLVALGVAALCSTTRAFAQTAAPTPNFEDEFAYPQVRLGLSTGSGARALGMGGAFIARPDDATAATWNPAGLSYLRLPEISFVYSGNRLNSIDVASTTRTEDERHGHSPDFFAVAYPFDLVGWSGAAPVAFQ